MSNSNSNKSTKQRMKDLLFAKPYNQSAKIRKIILSVFLSFFLILIYNSSGLSQGIRFGIFFDPHISWMKPDIKDVENDGARMGFKVGLSIENYFTENYAFYSGISIHNLGGKLKYADSIFFSVQDNVEMLPSGSTITYKLQYVTVPLGLKLKTDEIGYFTYFGNLGVYPQIIVKAIGDVSNSNITNSSIKDEVNLFNLGYYIGVGVEYSLGGNTAICIGLFYTNGLIDVTSDKNNQPTNRVIMNNIALNLGIIF
jgi:hypothetical protein